MTRISFYLLPGNEDVQRFACRLAEKVHHLGQRTYIHCPDAKQAQALDELLWTFRQGSFLPHSLSADDAGQVAVHIGAEPGENHGEVLINMGPDVPMCFSHFERVVEAVAADAKQTARDRYRFYQDRGYPLETHDLRQAQANHG